MPTITKKEEEEHQSSVEVGMNKMSVPHDCNIISLGYDISGAKLLTPLTMDIIVTRVTK